MSVYYVYKLLNPECGTVFYVGKGKANRAYQHQREVERNPDKYAKSKKGMVIKSILAMGMDVIVDFDTTGLSEVDALVRESELISEIGIDNLTNILPRGVLGRGESMPNYIDGVKIAAAWMSIADARLHYKYGSMLTKVHAELDEALDVMLTKGNKANVIKGISDIIHKKYQGFCSPLDLYSGYWKPVRWEE